MSLSISGVESVHYQEMFNDPKNPSVLNELDVRTGKDTYAERAIRKLEATIAYVAIHANSEVAA